MKQDCGLVEVRADKMDEGKNRHDQNSSANARKEGSRYEVKGIAQNRAKNTGGALGRRVRLAFHLLLLVNCLKRNRRS